MLLAGVTLLDDLNARDQLMEPVNDVFDLSHFIQVPEAEGVLPTTRLNFDINERRDDRDRV